MVQKNENVTIKLPVICKWWGYDTPKGTFPNYIPAGFYGIPQMRGMQETGKSVSNNH